MKSLLVTAVILIGAVSAKAAVVPECQAKVLVAVTDDLGNHWMPGKILPVDIERDNARGSAFCAHGGGCVPRKVKGSDALQLVNCKVGPVISKTDHRLVPDARLAGNAAAQAMTKRDEIERKLSDLGLSNASAGTLADEYVNHPQSANSKLVAEALAGSDAALKQLKHNDVPAS